MSDTGDDFAHLRRAHPLHEPRRCVVLDAKGEGLAYFDDLETALRRAPAIPRVHTIADAVTGTTFAKYYGASRAIRLPWEARALEPEELAD